MSLIVKWLDKQSGLHCRGASALLLAAQDRPLAFGERLKLQWHLKSCAACERFSRQVELMNGAMRRWREGAGDDPD